MAKKTATVVRVVKPKPVADQAEQRKVKHYGVSFVRGTDNVVEVRPFIPREMK